jgi:hypothetical protein
MREHESPRRLFAEVAELERDVRLVDLDGRRRPERDASRHSVRRHVAVLRGDQRVGSVADAEGDRAGERAAAALEPDPLRRGSRRGNRLERQRQRKHGGRADEPSHREDDNDSRDTDIAPPLLRPGSRYRGRARSSDMPLQTPRGRGEARKRRSPTPRSSCGRVAVDACRTRSATARSLCRSGGTRRRWVRRPHNSRGTRSSGCVHPTTGRAAGASPFRDDRATLPK